MKKLSKVFMGLAAVTLLAGCGKAQKEVSKDVFLERCAKIAAAEKKDDFKIGDVFYSKLHNINSVVTNVSGTKSEESSETVVETTYLKNELFFSQIMTSKVASAAKVANQEVKLYMYYEPSESKFYTLTSSNDGSKIEKDVTEVENVSEDAAKILFKVAETTGAAAFESVKAMGQSFLTSAETLVNGFNDSMFDEMKKDSKSFDGKYSLYLGSNDEESCYFEGSANFKGSWGEGESAYGAEGSETEKVQFLQNRLVSLEVETKESEELANGDSEEGKAFVALSVKYSAVALLRPNVDDFR